VVREKGGEIRYEVPYDKLVIAVGCYSASLGIEGVSPDLSIAWYADYRSPNTPISSKTSETQERSVRECCKSPIPL
jgi:NADPH-dependent 2,4-dienoyl-CoA reductase/sulfur reductase-like enzyme